MCFDPLAHHKHVFLVAIVRAGPLNIDDLAVPFAGERRGVGVGDNEGVSGGWSADEFCILKVSILSFDRWPLQLELLLSVQALHVGVLVGHAVIVRLLG